MSRRAQIAPFIAMEIAREAGARQANGERIARFDVGQPHFGAPASALAAAERAMRSEALGYTDGLGTTALRRAIAQWYGAAYGLDIDPARIVITTGASGAFTLAFLALFDDGARVALASPGYPPYRHILKALGLEAAVIEANTQDGLQMTAALLESLPAKAPIPPLRGVLPPQAGEETGAFSSPVAKRVGEVAPAKPGSKGVYGLDGVLIASPANPTGAMLSSAALGAVCASARTRGLPLISDEIYHGLTYEAPAQTALAHDDGAIVVSSFSKYWAMTGWRVGWIVAPHHLVKPIERLAQNLTVAPPTIGQVAALGALEARDECETRRELYAHNRALMLRELPGLKLPPVVRPDGAFYVLVDVTAHADDSMAFAHRLLDEGVAITPGVDFCDSRGHRWARLAYCRPTDEVEAGLERLAKVCSKG